jgi:radical SAM protein with 4Fe4S-binding SPASM domain
MPDLNGRIRRFMRSRLERYCYYNKIPILPYFPPEIFIEVTNYCNLKCVMCPAGGELGRKRGFIDISLFQKIISEAKGRGIQASLFLAGEPLLHKELPLMIGLAKEAGLRTRLHTNATILSEEWSRRLLESELDELSFSFDSYDRGRYEKTRIGASYDTTFANIRGFLRLKAEEKSSKPYTVIQYLANGSCQNDDHRLKEIFRGLPIDKFHKVKTHSWAGFYKEAVLYRGQRQREDYFPCRFLWNRVVISWDGEVYACCNDLEGRYIVGDAKKEKIKKIWNGDRMITLRRLLIQGEYYKVNICRDCENLFAKRQ